MKHTMKLNRITIATLIAACGLTASADEHEIEVEITGIEVNDNIYTPYYEARTVLDHEQESSAKWIELRVEYTTRGGWIDELVIDQLALVKENGEVNRPAVLGGKVTYINIRPGDHYAVVYMHPSLVERYQLGSYEVDTAAVFYLNGKEVARSETTKNGKERWSTISDDVKYKGHLLDHSETPFWFINYDFKEIIKHDRHMIK